MRVELTTTEVAAPLLNRLDTQPDNEKDTDDNATSVSLKGKEGFLWQGYFAMFKETLVL